MKKYIFLFLFLNSTLLFSQTKEIDSLESILKTEFDSYHLIHERLKPFMKDTLNIHYALKYSKEKENVLAEGYALYSLGSFYVQLSLFDKAINSLQEAYSIGEAINNINLQVVCLYKLGVANRRTGNIQAAIDYHYRSMEISEAVKQPSQQLLIDLSRTKSSLASAYLILQQYNKTIKYGEAALKIQDSLNYTTGQAINNQIIGTANEELGHLDKALKYYLLSLSYNNAGNSEYGRIINTNSIASIYIKQNQFNKAKELLDSIEDRVKLTEDQFQITHVLLNLILVNIELNRLQEVKKYLDECFKIARTYNLKGAIIECYYLESTYLSKIGAYKKALVAFKEGQSLKDEMINFQNTKYINDLTHKYESDRKSNKIKELGSQNEIVSLKLEKRQQIINILLAAIALILASLYLFFHQHQKRKDQEIVTLKREQQVKTLELLMEGEEKERLRIAKELHDGVNVDLSSIKYKLTSLVRQNDDVINETVSMIDKSCEQVRAISHNLVPPALKNFSLMEAIHDFCSTKNNLHQPEIAFSTLGETITISKKAEVNIFRIVQELINNSIKHANATEIDVQLSYQDNQMQLTIEDNGQGFNKSDVVTGIGLKNIQSRIDYLGAKLDFRSDNKGTSYVIDINTEHLV